MRSKQLVRASLAGLLGILLTLGIGEFIGYPLNADAASANIERMNEIAKKYPRLSAVELERIYQKEFSRPPVQVEQGKMDVIRSILKWHALILGLAVLATFFFLRPRAIESLVVGATIGAILAIWAGLTVGLMLILAVALYCLLFWRTRAARRIP